MTTDRIKVKRDGPRGWHWITAASYDPAIHEAITDEPDAPVVKPTPSHTVQTPRVKKTRGASSTSTEATNGDR